MPVTTESPSEIPRFSAAAAPPCPLCQQDAARTIHYPDLAEPFPGSLSWPAHDKHYCHECGYIWSHRFDGLDLDSYGKRYVDANTDEQRVPNTRMQASPRLLQILVERTGGGRFLDYGIGYNTPYIEDERSRGIDLWGCDISATVPYGPFVRHLPEAEPGFIDHPFDGIFSQDVVEHFNDPVSDHRRLRSMLVPGGMILSSTPVLEKVWDGSEPVSRHIWLWSPWHTSLCSSKAMNLLAEKSGLEFVDVIEVPTDTRWAFLLRRPVE